MGGKKGGMELPQCHIKFRVFTQGLCCLSGCQRPLKQVPFPQSESIWVRMIPMKLKKTGSQLGYGGRLSLENYKSQNAFHDHRPVRFTHAQCGGRNRLSTGS